MSHSNNSKQELFLIPQALPEAWPAQVRGEAYLGIVIGGESSLADLESLFPDRLPCGHLPETASLVVRAFKPGVTNPMSQSLGRALGIPDSKIRVDKILVNHGSPLSESMFQNLQWLWREPAIEDLEVLSWLQWQQRHRELPQTPERSDDSFATRSDTASLAAAFDLEFEPAELEVLEQEAKRRARPWNRAELEVFAQTWSEHCKHKIFAARVSTRDTLSKETSGLFREHIRRPTMDIMERRPGVCLSVFHDNAGVLALKTETGEPTDWAFCLKMETHNSPSAISPYGGSSTGLVGVHRDILGTGLGALPIANWNVLCFESPAHSEPRPSSALPADVIRKGVLHGIEDGGNQSGIPTVQGSVVFDPRYAVKPLVFAGSVGLMPKEFINKKPRAGLALYCFGGATGADGLRGAVMSSRDLRTTDFRGSSVQVASAFVQRVLTDFLMEARDQGLIDVSTDNGAGGFASSVGEMANLAGGATIDVTKIRLKFEGLHGWERLLSESQERMTIATAQPEALERLAQEWRVDFDRLGVLTNDGQFRVHYDQKPLVEIPLHFLHESCPQLTLQSQWTAQDEVQALSEKSLPLRKPDVLQDFERLLASEHLCSREPIVRRFDHEVQGRTLRKPFGGLTQKSPQDGSVLDVPETASPASIVLSHGLSPQRSDIVENVVHSFDEAVRGACLSGIQLDTAGMLDNFCWPDPITRPDSPPIVHRRLWRLVRACETLSHLCRSFDLPLISGKDSMKNNSKDFAVPETLVVSIGGSAGSRLTTPAGFFSRANEILFVLPLISPTLRDSAWERAMGHHSSVGRDALWSAPESASVDSCVGDWARELRLRYDRLSEAIRSGLIRSAKDISEGGLLTSVFEMSLGRQVGVHFESWVDDPLYWLGEGLGGFVLSIDPHRVRELELALPEARRLGVTLNVPVLRWGVGHELALGVLREAYERRGQEGFWR